MSDRETSLARDVLNQQFLLLCKRVPNANEAQHVPRLDLDVVGRVYKGQRQHTEVDQVLSVDAREALDHDGAKPEELRAQRGVLAA